MAYRFERGEVVADAIRRVAIEQLSHARRYLLATDGDREEQIHECRKCMKRLRGLVRLARAQLGDDVYRLENACYRDVARSLGGLRDTAALVEVLDGLVSWLGSRNPRSRFGNLRIWLSDRRAAAFAEFGEKVEQIEQALEVLERAEARVSSWPLLAEGFAAITPGLRRVYKRGRGEFSEVCWRPTADANHSWRKRVKYLWYHTQLLRNSWPAVMRVTQDELDRLGDGLGKDHDLALLLQTVTEGFPPARAASTIGALQRRIVERRAILHADCIVLGHRCYAERPCAYVRRLEGYWQAWVEEGDIGTDVGQWISQNHCAVPLT